MMQRTAWVLGIVAMVCLGGVLWAQPVAPTAHVQQEASRVMDIINRETTPNSPERQQRTQDLKAAIGSLLDVALLAERSLGSHWDTKTPEQRQTFVELLRSLIELSYTKQLREENLNEADYTVRYTGERIRRNRATVEATVTVREEEHFIEVKMLDRSGQWVIYDLVTDDVSLQESYAESFDAILTEEGWDALLQKMRDKVEELQAS